MSRPSTPNGSTGTPRSRRTCCSALRSARLSISTRSPTTTMCCRCSTKTGLIEDLVDAGKQVAETMIELFADLSPDHEFFEQFSFISAKDLPDFAAILGRIGAGRRSGSRPRRPRQAPVAAVQADPGTPSARHSRRVRCSNGCSKPARCFALIFRRGLQQQIEFFDPERYNAAASVQDNILFGKIAYGEADAPVRIPAVLAEVIDALSLRQTVIDVGLDYHVGTGGSRLSLGATAEGSDRARRAQAARPFDPQRGDVRSRRPSAVAGQQRGRSGILPVVASSGCCIAPASPGTSTASWF